MLSHVNKLSYDYIVANGYCYDCDCYNELSLATFLLASTKDFECSGCNKILEDEKSILYNLLAEVLLE